MGSCSSQANVSEIPPKISTILPLKGILKASPAPLLNWKPPEPTFEVNVLFQTCPEHPGVGLLGYYYRPIMHRLYQPEDPFKTGDEAAEAGYISSSPRTLKISWDLTVLDNSKPRLDPPKNTEPKDWQRIRPTMIITLPLTFAKLCPTMQSIVLEMAKAWPDDGDPTSEGFPITEYCRVRIEEEVYFKKCLDVFGKRSGCMEDHGRDE